jgi:alpha-L-rhamnosidase
VEGKLTHVRFEHHPNGLGLGTGRPRISWYLEGEGRLEPSGYEVERTETGERAAVEEYGQVLVAWPFEPLASRERAEIRVRAKCTEGWTPWSEPATAEAALLGREDWTARFVSPRHAGAIGQPAPCVRGSFEVNGPVAAARLYSTALGVYEAHLNNKRVGEDVLAPGWTSYQRRLAYQVYDVTGLLVEGTNFLAALLGNGWYRGQLTWEKRRFYGERLAFLAQLEVTYRDGRREIAGTGASWQAGDSSVLSDDIYDGQVTDLRAGAGPWGPVDVVDWDMATLFPAEAPPVRKLMTLPVQQWLTSPSGKKIADFGQNLVGWVRVRATGGRAGQEVTLRHAEVLEAGELATRPLRKARATDSYFLAGEQAEVLEPAFTFHGFRYAEISGVDEEQLAGVEAVVVGSDLERTGWFESSDPQLDRLHENVVWSMRGNFVSVPTDCPQRDERLGWTGDIQVFSPAAATLFDCSGFLSSWLADLAAEQQPDGEVPHVVPDVLGSAGGAAAWGDAATVVPWVLYERFGDLGALARQWESMRRWVDWVGAQAGKSRLWRGRLQFGDWLDPTAPPEAAHQAKADPDVVATACFARSAGIVARAAELLGRPEEAGRYGRLAEEVRAAFADAYVTPDGLVSSDAQTTYALALAWSLLPTDRQRAGAGRRLAELVRLAGHRIGTGFVGTPWVLDALSLAGYEQDAYRLLLQRRCPSWLYAVTMGATTIWERWDSLLPDGSVNPGQMTSFNHYAFGAVADYLHRRIAGLAPLEPGYRSVWVRPLPGPGLTSAKARQLTPYGLAEVSWRRGQGRFLLEVQVPQLVEAHVCLPGGETVELVGAGRHRFEAADPVAVPPVPAGADVLDLLGSGPAWAEFAEAYRKLTGAGEEVLLMALARVPRAPLSALVDEPIGPGNSVLGPEARAGLREVLRRAQGGAGVC